MSDNRITISQDDAQNSLNVWTHCEQNYSLAARELKIHANTVKRRVELAKTMGLEPSKDVTKMVYHDGRKKAIPLSEMAKEKDATPEECIDTLRVLQGEYDGLFITRNFFRRKSNLADSAWDQHFGTFAEFRKQAGLELSRHQQKHERDIAKHAAADNYREMNLDKQGYEGAYLKPSGKRFKKYIALMDIHDKHCDPFYRRIVLDTIKRVQPDVLILNGDIFDLYEFGYYAQDPRQFKVTESIAWVHQFLADCREACPDMQIDFIEGNHEFRLFRHLSEATPALKCVLSDLHGMGTKEILGIDEYEINYISRSNLEAFRQTDIKKEIGKNWNVYDEAFLASHYPKDKAKGMPGFNGHHHKHIVWPNYSPTYGSFEWHQSGCGHKRHAEYCDGEQWANGFIIVHCDTQRLHTNFEYVDVKDFAVIGGQYYVREEEETFMNF